MSGETNLTKLLNFLQPEVSDADYVFLTVKENALPPTLVAESLSIYRESEGVSVILGAHKLVDFPSLNNGDVSERRFKRITCKVHSSLDAVGMTAAMSAVLSKAGISANVVAAYYHDHIFVPAEKAEAAINALLSLKAA